MKNKFCRGRAINSVFSILMLMVLIRVLMSIFCWKEGMSKKKGTAREGNAGEGRPGRRWEGEQRNCLGLRSLTLNYLITQR